MTPHGGGLRCIIWTSALDAMYYDVISVRVKVRVRVLVRLIHLIPFLLSTSIETSAVLLSLIYYRKSLYSITIIETQSYRGMKIAQSAKYAKRRDLQ